MGMDIDFKDKLARRKQELMAERVPEVQHVSTYEERFLARWHAFTESVVQTSVRMIVGAALFSLLLSLAVFKDWWGFLGSPEYSQYKQRVEREASVR